MIRRSIRWDRYPRIYRANQKEAMNMRGPGGIIGLIVLVIVIVIVLRFLGVI